MSKSEAGYSCFSNQPRTRQRGHFYCPPLRPPAICGLVWAADSLAPLHYKEVPLLFYLITCMTECHPPPQPLCARCFRGIRDTWPRTLSHASLIMWLQYFLLLYCWVYCNFLYSMWPWSITISLPVILNLLFQMRNTWTFFFKFIKYIFQF